MNKRTAATAANADGFRLTLRRSNKKKGTAKWRTAIASATHCQPPCKRGKYQLTSSGRLAIQISMNSKNAMYAQITRNVKRRLLTSLSVSRETTLTSGGRDTSHAKEVLDWHPTGSSDNFDPSELSA